MCSNGWCRGKALQILSDLLEAVGAGDEPQQALCLSLGEAIDASTVAYVRFDIRDRLCTMTCWPHSVDIIRLKVVVEHLPRAFPLLVRWIVREKRPSCVSADVDPQRWRVTEAKLLVWEILGCRDVALVPLHISPDQLRLVVLARPRDFATREMHLLCAAQRPLAALDRVLSAGTTRRPAIAGRSGSEESDGACGELTPRETQVLRMVAEGLLARTIAARMDVSPRTVHKHLGNVYRKLETHDRLLAVHRAQALGLIPRSLTPAPEP